MSNRQATAVSKGAATGDQPAADPQASPIAIEDIAKQVIDGLAALTRLIPTFVPLVGQPTVEYRVVVSFWHRRDLQLKPTNVRLLRTNRPVADIIRQPGLTLSRLSAAIIPNLGCGASPHSRATITTNDCSWHFSDLLSGLRFPPSSSRALAGRGLSWVNARLPQ